MYGYERESMSKVMFNLDVASASVSVRMAFLRKVYGILFAQLLATALVCAGFMLNAEAVWATMLSAAWLSFPSIGCLTLVTIGLMLALRRKARETPTNFVLLLVFTVCQSLSLGLFIVFFEAVAVFQALALTLLLTAGLTLFALQSQRNFSGWEAPLFEGLLLLLGCLVMQIFLPSNGIWQFATSVGGALLFTLYIVFDTAIIMTKLSPEEYIFASVDLYLDVINLFIAIIRIIGTSKKE